jgi:hypothetical protein
MAHLTLLSCMKSPEETEGNNEQPESRKPVLRGRFERHTRLRGVPRVS